MISRFGATGDGAEVQSVTIGSDRLRATVLTFGAILQSVRLSGVNHDLTLGSLDLADYEGPMAYYGPVIGPVVNRIGNARVKIAGMMYELERNQDGRHSLHSGRHGTHRKLWTITDATDTSVTLSIDLVDGQCDLPGARTISARFEIADQSLTLTLTGRSDEATVMNLANHSYWNLDGSGSISGHRLQVHADHYLPTDDAMLPTGDVAEVAQTPFDFRAPVMISAGQPPLDTNFCLAEGQGPCREVLKLQGQSGVTLTLSTDAPGLQVYDCREVGQSTRPPYEGLALEAQFWPDAPNHDHFPSILLRKGQQFTQTTRWTFSRHG